MAWKGWADFNPDARGDVAGQAPSAAKRQPRVRNAQAVVVDGIRFQSKREAARWRELQLRVKAGTVRDLYRQVAFPLHAYDPTRPEKGFIRLGEYRADFVYFDVEKGEKVVEDVKGFRTEMYLWKKKHAEAEWGIKIQEV